MNPVLLMAVLLPTGAALLTPLVGRLLGRNVGWWATAVSAVTFGLLVSLGGAAGSAAPARFSLDWPAADWGVRFSLAADGWGWGFSLVVAGIGTLICLYAQHYLHEHEPRPRFFTYLLLFEGAMLGVVLSANLFLLVVFWELTSVTSFLLIGFWHTQERARYGAYKALLITGLGGLGLLAGVILLYVAMGTAELPELFARANELKAHPLLVPILLLILLGAFTKSAQFPFHLWLPDAMTAPTPVSAYLHSATMVKAGVFLLGRLHPLFRGTETWFWAVTLVGMATMLLGAYGAVRKTDLKALLAYSTISQLGLITLLYGFGTATAALAATFHIFNHAAFKAGLFLVVGIVDHETGTRDKRRLKGLARWMPVTAAICGACALASAGVPLLNGFLSKELFYGEMVASASRGWLWMVWPTLAVLGSVFTFVYSMEIFHGVFFGRLSATTDETKHSVHPATAPKHVHDPGWGMLAPAGVLAVICVLVGLWPGGLENWVLRPAVWAVWQQSFEFHVAIFHGFNVALMLSALTLAAGLVVYAQRHHLAAAQHRLAWPFGANTIYDGAIAGLFGFTHWLTDALQSGHLRRYFLWAVGAVLLAVGFVVLRAGLPDFWPAQLTPIEPAEGLLGLLLIVATVAVVFLRHQRLPAILALGAAGFMISTLYLVLSAPDLALTQLMIESVTVVLFVLVLWHLPKDMPHTSPRVRRVRDGVISVVFGVLITVLVLGVAAARAPQGVADYFIKASLPEAGGRNIVNVILVDFRGFDTLGEITVLSIAALGAYALIKLRRKKTEGAG